MPNRSHRDLHPLVPLSALAVAVALALSTPVTAAAEVGPAERVACQAAIEEVYWRHRIWPETNPAPKPELEEVLDAETLHRKAERGMRQSRALEELWRWRIDGAALQAEIDRMAAASRSPELLRELFAALDDDPRRVAECLARPLLAERLLRRWYERDERVLRSAGSAASGGGEGAVAFEAWWSDSRELFAPEVEQPAFSYSLPEPAPAGTAGDSWMPTPSLPPRTNGTAVWTGTEMIYWGGGFTGSGTTKSGSRYDPATDTWRTTSTLGAPLGRFAHSAVWTGSEMIVWGGCGPFSFELCELGGGGRYDPVADSWSGVSNAGAPGARIDHTAVWTGDEMIVWGGCQPISSANCAERDTGGRYDPATNTWQATSTVGAPAAVYDHAAVWTGSEMIVWGGYDGALLHDSGGRYDPATDSWAATALAGAPTGRRFHTAVWVDGRMVVWGGCEAPACPIQGDPTGTGGVYDPTADDWSPTSTTAAPVQRSGHTAVWTGSEMIVWGGDTGVGPTATGGRYDPLGDSWSPTSTVNAPEARAGHRAIWTGSLMVLWGGERSGGRYDPLSDSWTPTSDSDPGVGRADHTAVWTGSEMIVWGGQESTLAGGTGAVYTPATASWRPTSLVDNPSERFFHTAVWTGTEMIVWGGQVGTVTWRSGGRYDPVADGWTPTTLDGAPVSRANHTAVWTGSEMIVWGGSGQSALQMNSGGRYDPAADAWVATATAGAPAARRLHAAVWSGDEMIVWGGLAAAGDTATGGRYDPALDAWLTTAPAGAPSARNHALAVWSGEEMIVWGGARGPLFDDPTFPEDGGRYDPAGDSWQPTSLLDAPTPRALHTAVWSGEEMIVWGGCTDDGCSEELPTGARYEPLADVWTATLVGSGTPEPRSAHSAVWAGDEMIVWGGVTDQSTFTRTGARYFPLGSLPALHVDRIVMRFLRLPRAFRFQTLLQIVTEEGDGEGGVLVRLELERPDGSTRDLEATTDAPGRARVNLRTRTPGQYTMCVTALVKEGFVYDPAANEESCETIVLE